jgi:hypothetical protein
MRWGELVTHLGERRGVYSFLMTKREEERPPVRSRHRWEDNIDMELKPVWRAWTGLIWLRTGTTDGLL